MLHAMGYNSVPVFAGGVDVIVDVSQKKSWSVPYYLMNNSVANIFE